MKKSKFLKNASIVALSAVMMAGTAAAFTGCGGSKSSSTELTVYIFCSATDAATNEQICNTWAQEYTQKLRANGTIGADESISVKFTYNVDATDYSTQLNNHFNRGTAEDVFYLSPRFIKNWAANNRVLDLSEYISEEDAGNLSGIWADAIGFYGYSADANYTQGEALYYDANGASGAGMYTASGVKSGLYGLPKDYSNFAMAYNGKYYTPLMKEMMQTYTPTTTRSVKGAYGNTSSLTFTGSGVNDVITFAADGEYTVTMADGTTQTKQAKKGDPAPFVSVGVPVNIKPFNFYRYATYTDALASGDPIVMAMNQWAPGGYVVTLPGFPGDTFDIANTEDAYNADADYVASRGHVTFTYAEFGALAWLTTYFCNTFNWFDANNNNNATEALKGTAGMVTDGNLRMNVYGSGQYEGDPNPTLYMLPWLYGNDSDFINFAATDATNPGVNTASDKYNGFDYGYSNVTELDTIAKMQAAVAKQTSETRTKQNLDGTTREVETYYGVNSYNFLETYGAFLEFASTWNGNSENCGDEESKSDNSWTAFRAGYDIFYGSGTWDAQARNESDLINYCEFQTMPSPVAEKYALYSHVKDAFYNEQTYAWQSQTTVDGKVVQNYWNGEKVVSDQNTADRVVAHTWRSTTQDAYCKVFTAAEIKENQIYRQDKWGARMDSVGYSVNAELKNNEGTANAWKLEGAVSLALALSVNEAAQVTLSYGGAQLPNFIDQCMEFLYYNIPSAAYWTNSGKAYTDGAFKDMVTPEGFADTGYWKVDPTTGVYSVDADAAAEAAKIWSYYYGIINEMNKLATDQSETTIKEFMATKKAYGSDTEPMKYDTQYDNVRFKDFTMESVSYRAYAMKILYMQTYTLSDRDLQIRMQAGLNSARDSAMYTYATTWLAQISTRDGSSLAYKGQQAIDGDITSLVVTVASQSVTYFQTAAVHCLRQSQETGRLLAQARYEEKRDFEEGL